MINNLEIHDILNDNITRSKIHGDLNIELSTELYDKLNKELHGTLCNELKWELDDEINLYL